MSRFICLPWVWIELNPTQDPMELVVASIRSIIGPMQALAISAASFFSLDIVTSSVIARMQLHPPLDSRRYGETHMRGSSKSSTNISRMMPRCPLLFPSMITCINCHGDEVLPGLFPDVSRRQFPHELTISEESGVLAPLVCGPEAGTEPIFCLALDSVKHVQKMALQHCPTLSNYYSFRFKIYS